MNNELFNHQKSDAVKWVCTLLAFLIVGVLIAGIICGWFDKKETPLAEQTETGFIVTPDEINGVSLSVKAMSASANEVNAMAENSYTVTATIQPSTALQRANWSVAWKNGSSAWATGKTVTDYVTITPAEEGALTATLACVKPFSEQVILTVSAAGNADKTATCTVDYQQRPEREQPETRRRLRSPRLPAGLRRSLTKRIQWKSTIPIRKARSRISARAITTMPNLSARALPLRTNLSPHITRRTVRSRILRGE